MRSFRAANAEWVPGKHDRVVQGEIDIAWTVPRHTPAQFPVVMVAELPGAVPERMAGHDLLSNAHDAGHLVTEFRATKPPALWTSAPNTGIMREIDVPGPVDLAGLKIRVVGAASGATVYGFGASQ